MHYLTNITKSEASRKRCEEASLLSGQRVTYEDRPMPSVEGNPYYSPDDKYISDTYHSIVGHEAKRDYSAFWDAWNSLEQQEQANG